MYSVGSRPSDKGGVPGHHPDPEIEGGGGLKKIFFRPFDSDLILV